MARMKISVLNKFKDISILGDILLASSLMLMIYFIALSLMHFHSIFFQ